MFGIVRLFVRLIRIALAIAHWAEERVKEWRQERQFQLTEGRRQLAARNWSEAEKHLSLALAERRHWKDKRCELLLELERAQRRQGKLSEAEQTLQAALTIAPRRELRARGKTRCWSCNSSNPATPKPSRASRTSCRPRRPNPARTALAS